MSSGHSLEKQEHQQGASQEFISYYQQEMEQNIQEIRKIISSARQESNSDNVLNKIQNAGNAMSDLAMVYGFENEESIGRKIAGIAMAHNPDENLEVVFAKLEESTQAAEEALRRIREAPEEQPDQNWPLESPENSVGIDGEESTAEEAEHLFFDIKEDEKLISYLEDIDEDSDGPDSAAEPAVSESETNGHDDDHHLSDQNDGGLILDIPKQHEFAIDVGDSFTELDTDVMEIDFRESTPVDSNGGKSLLRKITGFFGFKGKKVSN